MDELVVEASYPLEFRKEDAKQLGEHLRNRHSVDLIGMKRVGISNFLRFFLNHRDIVKTYIHANEEDLFIPVDMNDLVEVETNHFWILTFKRIIDAVENSNIETDIKKSLNALFIDSIKTKDLFFTIDNIRTAFKEIIKADYIPTLFFLRFDRLKDIINKDFFSNLQGLKDGTRQKLAYVFTSYKGLNEIAPHVFDKKDLSIFSHKMYFKPAQTKDLEIIFDTFAKRYNIFSQNDLIEPLLQFAGGHVQYLHLSLIILNERLNKGPVDVKNLLRIILEDERVHSQSEEIYESLNTEERNNLDHPNSEAGYLFDVGIFKSNKNLFSPYFEQYIRELKKGSKKDKNHDLSKKENELFVLLLDNIGQIVDRDRIISIVWPESVELGVSDWTIDRLVARLRNKLALQKSAYSIVTVKTRGFKMTETL